MNERFWELVEQADEEGGDDPDIRDEVFARLIIQECAKVAVATPCPYDDTTPMFPQLGHTWDMACLESRKQILEHFGVEQ